MNTLQTPNVTAGTEVNQNRIPNSQDLITPREGLSSRVLHVINFYETLSPESLSQLHTVYTENAYFKDPFSEVYSRKDIHAIYTRMYQQVNEPRFKVHTALEQETDIFFTWHFTFRMKRYQTKVQQCCKGSSHLRLAKDGRVVYHRDYWDPCEELYEKIPGLRVLFKWLKKH
jgi:steroid delta-isomerase